MASLTCVPSVRVSGGESITRSVGSGATVVIHVVGLTDSGDCAGLINRVVVGATNEVPGANNTDGANIAVFCPDISVRKDGNGPISAGDDAVFTIVVTNNGPGVAHNVTVDDDLPPGISWALTPPVPGCVPEPGKRVLVAANDGMIRVDGYLWGPTASAGRGLTRPAG